MKHLVKFSGIAVVLLVLFTACQKEKTNEQDFEGIYQGTLTSLQSNSGSKSATSEISFIDENEIQVHCYSEGFDTTFIVNYYHHNDSAYVCYSGDDFEEMYGHRLGMGHMGGMMDDMKDGETEWMHHMDEEHVEGDDHFGGFDMANHRFSYTFQMNSDDSSDDLHFEGTKKQ